MTASKPAKAAKAPGGRARGRGGRAARLAARLAALRPRSSALPRWGAVLALALVTVALTGTAQDEWRTGKVATRTIRSDRDLAVPDPAATAEARLRAYNSALPRLLFDERPALEAVDSLHRLFEAGRALGAIGQARGQAADRLAEEFCLLVEAPDCPGLYEAVRRSGFDQRLERQAAWLALDLMGRGIVGSDPADGDLAGSRVELAREGAGPILASYDELPNLASARALARRRARLSGAAGGEADLAAAVAAGLIRPNLFLDRLELDGRRLQAAAAAGEVVHRVQAGEIIVREGQPLSARSELILAALSERSDRPLWAERSLGLLLLLLIFTTATQSFGRLERDAAMGRKQAALFPALLVIFVVLSWWSGSLGRHLAGSFDHLGTRTVFLAMPIPAAAMLGAIFLGLKRTVLLCFLGSFLGAVVAPVAPLTAFIYMCNGCLVSNWRLKHISERGRLLPAALMTALVNCLSLAGLALYGGEPPSWQLLADAGAACLSGLASGILASGLVPVVETVTGLTTNLKLLELGNLNRPILRDLMMAAPGTYHHSIIVGSMVEAAAEAIGANPHLARVGAYYHDIGKIKKPLYFIENQTGENKHETLTPNMSALVLVGHVKEGADLARERKLPGPVVDIVEQHHGTSLMSYFFHKAIERRGGAMVNEGDFRYPGPKPAGKEAGLVMLADICEAAARTLTDPTPQKIQELTRTLVNRVFDDGQLDSSELVLRDVSEAVRVFNNILVGIYHHRISYPGLGKEAEGRQAARSKVIYDHIDHEPSKRVTH